MMTAMGGEPTVPLLHFSRELARARTLNEIVIAVRAEMDSALGYRNVWLALREDDNAEVVQVLDFAGATRDEVLKQVPTIPIAGDAMMQEILGGNRVVVVEDARVDPRTNKAIVEAIGNRTIVNVPLAILDKPFGALGFGTFGEEGVKPPTSAALQHAISMASLVSVAAARIRMQQKADDAMEQQRAIETRLARIQRLDSVGTLAGGVAHDFNNLLTVILASASLARSAPDKAALDSELDGIESASRRAQLLTRQLLAMSRAQPLSLVHLDPAEVLTDTLALLKRVIPANIEIELIAPPFNARVEGDRTQLEQVLMNLCLNARDAMPEGGRLTVEAKLVNIDGAFEAVHPWAKPGRYVLVAVSDTGHGIPSDALEKIFDPFFTTKEAGSGTGLGLSIAHGIITQHRGMLHCYSELGIGTTFKIYLPVASQVAEPIVAAFEPLASGGTERILVGEDNEMVRKVVERLLSDAGYALTLAHDGTAVLDAVATQTFDLLLLDAVMPGPSCSEVVERVRALRPGLRIVLSSGYTADRRIAELIRDRSVSFLPKPYDPNTLLRALRDALD